MRFPNGLLAGLTGLLAVGLVGCSASSAPAPAPYAGSASPSSSSLASPAATESIPTQVAGPTEPLTKAGA